MRCPHCGHDNVTAFEFCEECLGLLPGARWNARADKAKDVFDFSDEHALETLRATAPAPAEARDVSPFPWNPPGHRVDPLVGRSRELAAARAAVRGVIERWSARIELVLGSHGIGTSTFVARLKEAVTEESRDAAWAVAWCRDEPTRPYAAIGRLLRDHFKIPPQLDDWMAGERFVHEVCELYKPEQRPAATELAQLVAFLVGFKVEGSPYLAPSADDAATLTPRASQALTRLLTQIAFDRPAVFVLDEAHNASGALLGLLDLLATGLANAPVLLVCVGRPELRDVLPAWRDKDSIELRPLGRADTLKMLGVMLEGVDEIPEELGQRVFDKSGGNPYAVRTIVRYLHEMGVITPVDGGARWIVDETGLFDLEIPDTLRGVASARLAQLDDEDRSLLQQAAVAGSHFWLGTLVALQRQGAGEAVDGAEGVGKDRGIVELREHLDALVERELLTVRRDRALPGEDAWAFTSELDRELLYEQCPAHRRARIHRMVGRWMELQPAAFTDGHISELAGHYDAGGEPWRAARVLTRAAQHARDAFQHDSAIRLYEGARRLTADDDHPTHLSLLRALGRLYTTVGRYEQAIGAYRGMLRRAWLMRDRARGALALNRLGQALRATGHYARAEDHLLQALQLYRAVHDEHGVADALDDLGQLAWLRGELDKALMTYERSKRLRTQLKDPRGLALTIHYIGCVHLDKSQYDAGARHLRDALALRRKLRDRDGVAKTLNNLAIIDWGQGHTEQALASWREGLEIARDIDNRPVISMVLANLGESLLQLGRVSEAGPLLQEAEALARAAGDRRTLSAIGCSHAALAMAQGHPGEARAAADAALKEASALGNTRLMGLAHVTRGDVRVAIAQSADDDAELEAGVAEMVEGVKTLEDAKLELDSASALEQLASTLSRLGWTDEAEDAARSAAALFEACGLRPPPRQGVAWPETQQPETKQPETKPPEAKQPEAKQPPAKQAQPPAPTEPREPALVTAGPAGDAPTPHKSKSRSKKKKKGKRG